MSFNETLATFVGQTVEVYQTNQFFTGQLLSVSNDSFVVAVVSNDYSAPITNLTIFTSTVQLVRVISA